MSLTILHSKILKEDRLNGNDIDIREMKNPERKRFREKLRRERVNASFENLKRLLGYVNSQRYHQLGGSSDMSQEEIVNATITVIHQLTEENINAQRKIEELQSFFKNVHIEQVFQLNPIHPRNQEWRLARQQSQDLTINYGQVPA
jgi:hypothetical protein